MQELTGVTHSLAKGKAVEPGGVLVQLFKITLNGDPTLRRRLLDIVVCIWRGGGAAAVEICHHHGTPQKEGSHASKILLKIITCCLSEYCERVGILPEDQSSFRPNRFTTDVMFVIRRLQEELVWKKRIILYVCFIGLTKTYESVDRTLLCRVLACFGVPQTIISVIRQFHDGMRACMQLGDR